MSNPPPAYDLQRSPDRRPASDDGVSAASESVVPNPSDFEHAAFPNDHHIDIGIDIDDIDDDDETARTAALYAPPSAALNTANSSSDATAIVHEMHLALLYLLSNPDEFARAAQMQTNVGNSATTTLAEWNAAYSIASSYQPNSGARYSNTNDADTDSLLDDTVESTTTAAHGSFSNNNSNAMDNNNNNNSTTPLPWVVFADDAEVVLPQAHTASQLFGVEKVLGMELEAAAGIPEISQLFLRWLALMPNGNHVNIIDPPGVTVMKIAGGRYRVTAAHRVVWTWMNDFYGEELDNQHQNQNNEDVPTYASTTTTTSSSGAPGSATSGHNNGDNHPSSSHAPLQIGDLVTLTIVDVFETDNRGKLLSYCPTFDNRNVRKTFQTAETIRKSSHTLLKLWARHSATAQTILGQAARSVKGKLHHAVQQYQQNQNQQNQNTQNQRSRGQHQYQYYPSNASYTSSAASAVQQQQPAATKPQYAWEQGQQQSQSSVASSDAQHLQYSPPTSTNYHGDDDTERHEV